MSTTQPSIRAGIYNRISKDRIFTAATIPLAALLIGAPAIAHADSAQDQQFIAEISQYGSRALGTSQADWEQSAIAAGHEVCTNLALPGATEGSLSHHLVDRNIDKVTADGLVRSAVDVYCPQYANR
ncbi:DUF732 domain-containing protein [Mycobacterium sp.]|uniref:DUF732 domain-containing protein n=1 Tax=Mycobacterium sp. TaxID=1785 RepID=UPI003F979B53